MKEIKGRRKLKKLTLQSENEEIRRVGLQAAINRRLRDM